MGNKHINNRNRKPWIPILAVTILALTLAGIGGLAAKYRSEKRYEAEMIAADFHISSDMLEEPTKKASHQVADWKNGFQIELYNYEKENVALVASEAITYEVTVSPDQFICSIEPAANPVQTLTGGEKTVHTLTVRPQSTSVKPGDITVTVKTTAPFVKELQATFHLVGTQQPELKWERITDNGDYYLATITTGQYAGTVTLDWTEGLQPDNNHAMMAEWTAAASKNSFEAAAFTAYELIFFNPKGITDAEMNISTAN